MEMQSALQILAPIFAWPACVAGGTNYSPCFTDSETEAVRKESTNVNILSQSVIESGSLQSNSLIKLDSV